MTDMRRMTISLPKELDELILELRKDERFIRCSYSEIVRQVLDRGFATLNAERSKDSAFHPAYWYILHTEYPNHRSASAGVLWRCGPAFEGSSSYYER